MFDYVPLVLSLWLYNKVPFVYLGIEMIFQVESFLYTDKQGIPEEGQRIQWLKRCVSIHHNKDEDNSPENHNQKEYFSFI